DDTYGRISQLAARYVSVVARDGREFLIPNEDLITNKVVNWSFSNELVRLDVHFGVSYKADPHAVRRLACTAALPQDRVVSEPAPVCHITGFGDSSVDYILRFWIRDPDQGTTNIRGHVFLALWDALKEAGIEIPYPHRELLVSSPVPVVVKAV
ncbi:MAG: mechanosensitive ion channel family protein, partial [Aestuariivirgaceae bacterium]